MSDDGAMVAGLTEHLMGATGARYKRVPFVCVLGAIGLIEDPIQNTTHAVPAHDSRAAKGPVECAKAVSSVFALLQLLQPGVLLHGSEHRSH